jgi:hypothetical protein
VVWPVGNCDCASSIGHSDWCSTVWEHLERVAVDFGDIAGNGCLTVGSTYFGVGSRSFLAWESEGVEGVEVANEAGSSDVESESGVDEVTPGVDLDCSGGVGLVGLSWGGSEWEHIGTISDEGLDGGIGLFFFDSGEFEVSGGGLGDVVFVVVPLDGGFVVLFSDSDGIIGTVSCYIGVIEKSLEDWELVSQEGQVLVGSGLLIFQGLELGWDLVEFGSVGGDLGFDAGDFIGDLLSSVVETGDGVLQTIDFGVETVDIIGTGSLSVSEVVDSSGEFV